MAIIGWLEPSDMGSPLTANLVAAGHTVRGFYLNPVAAASAPARHK